MKKLLLVLALAFSLLIPSVAFAQYNPTGDACTGDAANSPICTGGDRTDDPIAGPDGVIANVLTMLSYVVGAVSVIILVFSGLKFVTSNGDPNSVKTARNSVIYALIGIAIFLAAQFIVGFVLTEVSS